MPKGQKLSKQLINHRSVAKACDIDTETIREWVAKGDFPQPHSIIQQTWLYDKAIIDHWLETGLWPEGTKFRQRRMRELSGDHQAN